MRRLAYITFGAFAALAAAMAIAIGHAQAATCNPYPYTLVNGQIADANQVMADFNLVRGCVTNNAASIGANADIHSLSGLTTPLSVAQGGTGNNTGAATSLSPGGTISITGDLAYTSPTFTGSNVTGAGTLATVNSNVGAFQDATITVNAKGLITAASNTPAATTSTFGPTKLADGTATLTGTSTTLAVTPGSLTSQNNLGATCSNATSCQYVTLPGGYVIQSGISGTVTGGSSLTVGLGITLGTACYSAVITRVVSSGIAQAQDNVSSCTTSQFVINNNAAGHDSNYYWIVVGK